MSQMELEFVSDTAIEEEPFGGGHFGQVYSAVDPVHGQVAIKVYRREENESDDDWVERGASLVAEGKKLKEAEHPNVVRVYGVVMSEDVSEVRLTMEMCHGGTLHDISKKGPSRLHTVRNFLNEITLGLGCIHSRGMLHRDIRPKNILLHADGSIKLGDFGGATTDIIAGYGDGFGYTDFLAPEALLYRQTSIKTDIWMLGITAYRLLHGEDFYGTLPPNRFMVAKGGFAKSLPFLPHIPKSWRNFLKLMLHDETTKRVQNTNEVLKRLATLPVEPGWECGFSSSEVRWQRAKAGRIHEVIWDKSKHPMCSWVAHSLPLPSDSTGRKQRIGGSDGLLLYKDSVTELDAYFAKAKI